MGSGADLVRAGYRAREEVIRSSFQSDAARLATLCHAMARRFSRGGRLLAFGVGAAATDAQHVAVEFVHPVIVGKRALPAIALVNDVPSTLRDALADPREVFARRLAIMSRSEDMVLGIVHSSEDPGIDAVSAGLKAASQRGLLTIWLGSGAVADDGGAEHAFRVPSDDPFLVQEVHETIYHVLWELVHVFFEHKGLLDGSGGDVRNNVGASSFLYPFLADAEEAARPVLDEIEASAVQKAEDVIGLRRASAQPEELVVTARLMADRVAAGATVLAFGNGGSATDAQDLVTDLVSPPNRLPSVPALSLTNDEAVVTAVGNDVGFENVFARQMIAYGKEGDVAVAISTSGGSRNVLAAVEQARRRGLLVVGLAGYGGGALAELCDRAHVVDGDYIPRIQEAQATLYHSLRILLTQ